MFYLADFESSAFVRKGQKYAGGSYTTLYPVEDKQVAVMNLFGPIYPRASLMEASSEGLSLQKFVVEFAALYNDPEVSAVVLNSDSPGGDARGLGDTADFMFKLANKGTKPFLAFASGYMCSAAYYLAAPAHKIYASKSAMVGSIGAVTTVKKSNGGFIDITSDVSPLKRPDVDTEEGLASYKQKVNDLGNQFVSDVALFRGVDRQKVLEDYGQGDYMLAFRAKNQGLIDGISTLSSVVEEAATLSKDKTRSYRRKTAKSMSMDTEVVSLDVLPLNEEITMGLKNILERLTMSAPSTDEQAQATTATESAETEANVVDEAVAMVAADSGPVPTREELEDRFSEAAELFALQTLTANKIVPAMQATAVLDFVNAKIDDALYGGEVKFVNETGQLVSGTREDQVRARYNALTPHNKTAEVVEAVKEGTTAGVVLPEVETEKVKVETLTEERVVSLLGTSTLGRAVLANRANG